MNKLIELSEIKKSFLNKYYLKVFFITIILYSISSHWNYVKSQQTSHLSFGLNYGFKQINMQKTSQTDYFIFNDVQSEKYNWTQEDLDDFNQTNFRYNIHQTAVFIFSGLSGSDSSKFRFGFGINAGVFSFKEIVFLEKDFQIQKGQSVNLFGDIVLYTHYKISDKLTLKENLSVSYYKNDFNDVERDNDEISNTENYTVTYDNIVSLMGFSSTTLIDYKWKNFNFNIGPQFVYYMSNSDYSQYLTHNSSGDLLKDYESYDAKNAQLFRVGCGINYQIKNRISTYINISFWKDIELKFGIQF